MVFVWLVMFSSTGSIRSSPTFPGQLVPSKCWVVVDVDPEIGRYYRSLYRAGTWDCAARIQRPSWKEHISVVRNEEPPNDDLWGSLDGRVVEFRYDNEVCSDGLYFWLNVECDELLDLRQQMGLSRRPEYPLHITLGNAKYKTQDNE